MDNAQPITVFCLLKIEPRPQLGGYIIGSGFISSTSYCMNLNSKRSSSIKNYSYFQFIYHLFAYLAWLFSLL